MTLFPALALLLAAGQFVPFDEATYGKVVTDGRGKVLLVNFWATWCSPCRAEMPLLVKLEARLRGKGLRMVTVSADEPEQESEALKFLTSNNVSGPWYLKKARNDDAFIRAVDPKWSGALPALFLYDRGGRRVRVFVGETDMKVLEAEILKLL